tara:strand:+ start:1251 stop:1430 length:180 start_codon:yes stop_codon:yes gene_type:complete
MDKEKARKLLNEYLKNNPIPIEDVIIHSNYNHVAMTYSDWTFKFLLCMVYDDLERKKSE